MSFDQILHLMTVVGLFAIAALLGYHTYRKTNIVAGAMTPGQTTGPASTTVLMVAILGLVSIQLAIIAGIFLSHATPPNWAENVLVSLGTAAALKLGDCLSALVALSTGKSLERVSTQLGNSIPSPTSPLGGADASGNAPGTNENPIKTQVVDDKGETMGSTENPIATEPTSDK